MSSGNRTFDINFLPQNQQTPNTSSIPGQLRYVRNGQVKKFDGTKGPQLKLEKRNGFRQLSKEVRDVTSGALINQAGFPVSPTLFSSLENEQVVVSQSHPYVLSENATGHGFGAWSKFPYVYSPTIAEQRPVYTANTQVLNPDGASIGEVFLRTWSETVAGAPLFNIRAMFLDADGTPIREPFTIATDIVANAPRAKCVSDGTYFWVIWMSGATLEANVYDVHGVLLANLGFFAMRDASNPWDLTFQQGSVLACYRSGASTDTIAMTRLTFDGVSTITSHPSEISFNCLGNNGCAWAENDSGDNKVYLLTSHWDADVTMPIERAFQIGSVNTSPAVTHFYGPVNTSSSFIYADDGINGGSGITGILCEMTGVNTSSGFYVQLSFLQNDAGTRTLFGDHALSRTVFFNLSLAAATPTVDHYIYSVVMASRTFKIDGRNVAMMYYPSGNPSTVVGNFRYLSEPTYFLIDIVTGQVCGEFNWAAASMEWARDEYPTVNTDGFPYGPFYFCVGHVFVDGFSLDAHVSVSYQAQAVNETFIVNDIIGNGTRLTSTIGFEDIKFGGLGQAVEYADELLMPGPLATSFTGYNFGENSLLLAPEQPTTVQATFGGAGLTLLGIYNYILVFERTLPNGDRVRSAVSVPTNLVTLTGSHNQITLSGYPLHMTTYSDVIVSIYRNIMVAGAPSVEHYKVTDDLDPVFNDTTAQTFTYVDHKPDADISANEVLYTDLGFVNRIPCPPFSVGCVFENRQFVIGPDGALWFSGEKSEGDAIWFTNNPNFRQALPTNDPVKQLIPMDGRIGIICERSVWAATGGGYPGPDGLGGNLQAPQKLPFIGGGTGFSAAFPGGALYSSSSPGETYVLTRGLENVQIGANAVDDLNGRTIVGITVDSKQRIYFGLAEDSNPAAIEVYDQLVKAWFQYLPPTEVFLLHNVRNALAYADHNSVWVQDDSLWRDVSQLSMGSPVPPFLLSDYQTEFIALGGIKDFQQIWDQIISGTYEGSHVLTVTTVTDINGELVTTVYTFTPDASGTYIYSLPPRVTECSRISFRFQDSFGNLAQAATGNTFSVEAISLNVVTDSGLARLEIPKVIEQESAPVTGVITGSSAFVTTLRLNGGSEIKIIPGQTTFSFPSVLAIGDTFSIVKKSGPGTVVNGTGIVGNPQLTTPTLSL